MAQRFTVFPKSGYCPVYDSTTEKRLIPTVLSLKRYKHSSKISLAVTSIRVFSNVIVCGDLNAVLHTT